MAHRPGATWLVVAASLVVLAGTPAWAGGPASAKAGLIRLQGDSDDAILLAQAAKEWLLTDLGSQRTFQVVKYVIVQHWARERGLDALDARERQLYRDPARYDRPIVQNIWVSLARTPETKPIDAVLTWDVPLELWQELVRDVTAVMADLARHMSTSAGRPARLVVRFRDAEVLRLTATAAGEAYTIFSYR